MGYISVQYINNNNNNKKNIIILIFAFFIYPVAFLTAIRSKRIITFPEFPETDQVVEKSWNFKLEILRALELIETDESRGNSWNSDLRFLQFYE